MPIKYFPFLLLIFAANVNSAETLLECLVSGEKNYLGTSSTSSKELVRQKIFVDINENKDKLSIIIDGPSDYAAIATTHPTADKVHEITNLSTDRRYSLFSHFSFKGVTQETSVNIDRVTGSISVFSRAFRLNTISSSSYSGECRPISAAKKF